MNNQPTHHELGNEKEPPDVTKSPYAPEDSTCIVANESTAEKESNEKLICAVSGCTTKIDKYKLDCSKCHKPIHFECTNLPAYQLYLFTRKKYRLYICERCVTENDTDISHEFIERSIENKIQNYEESLKEIEQQHDLIEALKKQLQLERTKHEKTKRELDLKNNVIPERQNELQKKVVTLEERSLKDKEQLNLLRTKVKHLESTLESTAKSSMIKENISTQTNPDTQYANTIDTLLSKIEEKIDATINRKFTEVESYANAVKQLLSATANDGSPKKHSTDGAPQSCFQDIIKEARKVQLDEERDKKIRATNLIIHGVSESSNLETSKREDEEFINSLFHQVEIGYKPKAVLPLSKRNNNNNKRPLEIVMARETEIDEIMSNLYKLKDANDAYKKISITHGYTVEERAQIKSFSESAKAKKTSEGENSKVVWKVRGSPKAGLKLAMLPKK